ncbi:putative damage-inducible protein DinB [Arcicella aurantiaca]|uniref:Putative damage-inducible protein DinB n=1 Tax=Arcicella aurantiaca TaxID=591202 RepID=A0A316DG88_9BACT|nr:DinB family protein [Arcicella aurantiaca]PWK17317.1 putative damage-inducible protein DinB [Arcicella aurantiaca]
MSVKKIITSYATYNLSANKQFVNWLSKQSEEQLLQEVPSSFKGILQTLNHIWAIEEMWCADLFKNDDAVNRYGVQDLNSKEVFEGLLNRSSIIAEKVNLLTDNTLAENISIKTPWFEANLTLAEYLQHLFNHGTYHRGQIITIAHHLGFTEMPSTDFLFYSLMASNQS